MNVTELEAWLQQRRSDHLYRQRQVVESAQGAEVVVSGRRLVNFSSNDYLGLANHPEIIRAWQRGAGRYGVGSGAAHLICGHMGPHHELEEDLAEFTGRERALLFSTGYQANLGVIAALLEPGERLYQDRLNHASLLDGARIAGARLRRYPHGDTVILARWLARQPATLIATDGVFSMDGDLAPLPRLADLAGAHDAWLYVDDAHGFGVLGENGAGTLEHYRLRQDQVPVLMATLGKAVGVFGAFVAGSETLIEALIQRARTYTYTTALPPAVAEAVRAGLKLIREQSWRREYLRHLIARFRQGAKELGLPLMPFTTPIQPLLVGDSQKALTLSRKLWELGFWVAAIRPPTVPKGSARLRITLTAGHGEDQVDQLLDALSQCLA